MVLFSRLPLVDCEVRFLVQDDVPSVLRADRAAGGGARRVPARHAPAPAGADPRPGLHPARRGAGDGGQAIERAPGRADGRLRRPERRGVVVHDQLFLRLSRLLDPRRGRGMYNSFNANSRLLPLPAGPRVPLATSSSWSTCAAAERRLGPLSHADRAELPAGRAAEQPEPEQQPERPGGGARRSIEKQAEAAATGDDMPGRE